jgi:thiol-disulfide isomerase/thioredoxin
MTDSAYRELMKVLKYLLLVLCMTAGGTAPAEDEVAGIGVELKVVGQSVVVNRIVPDTPAAAQKDLHVGDRIIAVSQDRGPTLQVQHLMEMVRSIRGPKDTTVRLTIISSGEDDSHTRVVSFVRGELESLWGDGVLLGIGTQAPDIEMVELANKRSERLPEYTDKTVVLEFWASWCGPCQSRMAELQGYPGKYPNWKTNVVLIAASIDESADIASKHLKAKGWNETHNVWVDIHAVRAYHIGAIPTVYVIGRQGKIVAVNPRDLLQVVNHELEHERAADDK